MEDSVLTSVILPVSLAVIMFGMGLFLVADDFKRVFRYPKAAIIGLGNQLFVLPILGFVLAVLFGLSPVMALGIMIIAVCPGGPTSNLMTHVAKGDIALSISLTAIASFITVFTIPVILSFSLSYFAQESGTVIELPVLRTIIQIMAITIIPVIVGMVIRRISKRFADKMEKPMRIASTMIFAAVLAGIIAANKNSLVPYLQSAGPVTLLLNLLTMFIGFFLLSPVI